MRTRLLLCTRVLLLGFVIPLILSTIVYQFFSTNLTSGELFSKQGFEGQYENGVYKYRVLGRILLLKTYDLITLYQIPASAPKSILDGHGDPQFYAAYFFMNTIFLCLTSVVLFFIFDGHHRKDFTTVELPLLFLCILMAITQFVVVPYDTLSYFFVALAAQLIIHDNRTSRRTIALGAIVILATLTRESSSLILAFYFAINYRDLLARPANFRLNQKQRALLTIAFCFLCTYVGLRFIFGYEHAVYQRFRLLANMTSQLSVSGAIFFASLAFLLLSTKPSSKEISVFFIAALPYILPIFLAANTGEIRLWTPVIILAVILKVRASRSQMITQQEPVM